MSDRLWIATRKGLFRLRGTTSGWEFGTPAFPGQPVSMILPDPRDGAIYAALNLGHFGVKLHRSDDGGDHWTEVAVPTFARADDTTSEQNIESSPSDAGREAKSGQSLVLIWALEPAGPNVEDGLWAGTIPGALFHSQDRGESWAINQALASCPERPNWFGGGYDQPGVHSICVDPRDSNHILIAISCGGVMRTRDRGLTWSTASAGMFAEFMPPERREDPTIQDAHRMVRCPAAPDSLWVQHHNGIFKSVDNADTWAHVADVRPSSFGFAVAVHPTNPDVAWFVPAKKDEFRYPVDGRFVLSRTQDGSRSFQTLAQGLPTHPAYDLVYRHGLDVAADGRTLAVGSTTGHLWTSRDGGDSFTPLPANLPPIYAVRFG